MAVVDSAQSTLDAEILSEVKSWLVSLGDVDSVLDGWRMVGFSDGGTFHTLSLSISCSFLAWRSKYATFSVVLLRGVPYVSQSAIQF